MFKRFILFLLSLLLLAAFLVSPAFAGDPEPPAGATPYVSAFGTPAIDGSVRESVYTQASALAANISEHGAFGESRDAEGNPLDPEFELYGGKAALYTANDSQYVYFYLTVTQGNIRHKENYLYVLVDFLNTDGNANLREANNEYQAKLTEKNAMEIMFRPNYAPYRKNGSSVSVYSEGATDRSWTDTENGVTGYYASINGKGCLTYNAILARYSPEDNATVTPYTVNYEIRIPLPDEVKASVAAGEDYTIGVSYHLYINQNDSAKAHELSFVSGEGYTTDGENQFEMIRQDYTMLTDVRLTGDPDPKDPEEEEPQDPETRMQKWMEESRRNFYDPALEDLTVNAFGDSYFGGQTAEMKQYVWPQLLANKYGWKFMNYGKNGGMVSAYPQVVSYSTPEPMVTRYASMKDNNPHIVIVDGGRNDYNAGTPIGTLESDDPKTFMGALNIIIDGLRKKYPNAMLVFTTVWKFDYANDIGLTYLDYAEAMETVCEAKGVYCFRAYDPDISGVDMSNAAFRAQYSLKSSDRSHLNLEGMKLVMPTPGISTGYWKERNRPAQLRSSGAIARRSSPAKVTLPSVTS